MKGLQQPTDAKLARLEAELDEEFAFHVESTQRRLELSGQTPQEAGEQARRIFGDSVLYKSQCAYIAREDAIMLKKLHAILTVLLLIGVTVLGSMLYLGQQRHIRAMESLGGQLGEMERSLDARVDHLKQDLDPVARNQSVVLDSQASESQRLQALRELRFADGDGRSHEVVVAMLGLASETSDTRVRADIYRQLDEVKNPIMVEPLLESLANSSDSEVREEAAESLGGFATRADVREALQTTTDHDQSSSVRQQAQASLMRGAEVQELQQVITSADTSEMQKLVALRQIRFMPHDDGESRSHAVIVAIIDVARSTNRSDVRADIFRQLDGVTDPVLQPVLLEALTSDPSSEVRSEAAETLAHYTSAPEVVAALQKAAAEDQDADVQSEARRSLGESP
ncbi:MAG: HEAT repeat domain-containing protein [Planctomycetaceae bacterium]|nr:HEAT repeat domain-containing protein [Planctomycetaceae bacterium]